MKSAAARSQKNKNRAFVNQNPIEAFKDVGRGVTDSFVSDLGGGVISGLWEQMLGAKDEDRREVFEGDLSEGQEINLRSFKKKDRKETAADAQPLIDYRREIIHSEETSRENTRDLQIKIREILAELKNIAATSQEIAAEFKEITVEQRIEEPGQYHLTFFEWMLSLVRETRAKIDDSNAWLSVMKSKKTRRGYWAMFAKHGTTFGLSNERVVATQTG